MDQRISRVSIALTCCAMLPVLLAGAVSKAPPSTQEARPLTPGVVVTATLTADDQVLSEGEPFHLYSITCTEGQTYSMWMASEQFDTLLYLYDSAGSLVATDDDGFTGTNSKLTFQATQAGSYLVYASSYSAGIFGSYRLVLYPGMHYSPQSATWTGGSLAASLDPSDGIGFETGWQTDYYLLDGMDLGRMITIVMRSAAFDSYLMVVDSDGRLLVSDDDSAGARDAMVTFPWTPAPEQLFYLVVTSASSGQYGGYFLQLTSQVTTEPSVAQPPALPTPVALPTPAEPPVGEPGVGEPAIAPPSVAQPVVAQPQGAEPPVAEPLVAQPPVAEPPVAQPPEVGTPAVPPPTPVPSTPVPPTSPVPQPQTPTVDAPVVMPPAAEPTAHPPVAAAPVIPSPPTMGPVRIAFAERTRGRLEVGDGTGNRQGPVDTYTFVLDDAGVLRLDLSSDDFDTFVQVFGDDGRLVFENDDLGRRMTDSEILEEFAPGAYTIQVSSFDGETLGEYWIALHRVHMLTEPLDISLGDEVDSRWTVLHPQDEEGRRVALYSFRSNRNHPVTILLKPRGRDAYCELELTSGRGRSRVETATRIDDGCVIVTEVEGGETYELAAIGEREDEDRRYFLTIAIQEPSIRWETISLDRDVRGHITWSSPFTEWNAPGEGFTFEAARGERLYVRVFNTDIDARVVVTDLSGTIIASTRDSRELESTSGFSFTVPETAWYRLVVTGRNHWFDTFTLQVNTRY